MEQTELHYFPALVGKVTIYLQLIQFQSTDRELVHVLRLETGPRCFYDYYSNVVMTSITAAHSKQKGMIHLDLFSWDNNVKKLFPKQNTCFCGVEHLTLMGFFTTK